MPPRVQSRPPHGGGGRGGLGRGKEGWWGPVRRRWRAGGSCRTVDSMLWISSCGLPEGFGCGRVIHTTLVRDGIGVVHDGIVGVVHDRLFPFC